MGTETTTSQQGSKLTLMDWEEIVQQGSYVHVNTGFLCRVPPSAIAQGRSPVISLEVGGQFARVGDFDDPAEGLRITAGQNGLKMIPFP